MGVDFLDDLSYYRHDGWVLEVCGKSWVSRCLSHDGGRREREDERRVTGDEEAGTRGWGREREPKRLEAETDESLDFVALLGRDGSGGVAELRRIPAPAVTKCNQPSEHEGKEQGHDGCAGADRRRGENLTWRIEFNQSTNNPLFF